MSSINLSPISKSSDNLDTNTTTFENAPECTMEKYLKLLKNALDVSKNEK